MRPTVSLIPILLLFLGLLSTTTAIAISDIRLLKVIAGDQFSSRASPPTKHFHPYRDHLLRRAEADLITQHRDATTSILQTYFQKESKQNTNPLTSQATALRALGTKISKIPDAHILAHIQTILNSNSNSNIETDQMLQEFLKRHPDNSLQDLLKETRNEQSKTLQSLSTRRKDPKATRQQINTAAGLERDRTTVLQGMLIARDTSLSPEDVAKMVKDIASKGVQDLRFDRRRESVSFRELVGNLRDIPI